MSGRIYLDHAATTPLDPRVLDAMLPHLQQNWGNPSSSYHEGRQARKALDGARRTVARLLGAKPAEIVFTAGGSESDNLAIRGVIAAAPEPRPHVVTTSIEHHAVLHTVQSLERQGACRATYAHVDHEGLVDTCALEASLTPATRLVSVMYANNEVGAVQPLAHFARIVKQRQPGAVLHTDAVQAGGALELNVDRLGVDLMSLAAHKFYGPKGVGALYVRSGVRLAAQTVGGAQERDRRAGTENVAGAVGLAAALELATNEMLLRNAHCARLRDRLLTELPARIDGIHINGPGCGGARLPNNANFSIDGVESETLLMYLDVKGIAASSGSACTSGSLEPSHVLTAMGRPPHLARNSLRLSVGHTTSDADIDRVLAVLQEGIGRLRNAGAR